MDCFRSRGFRVRKAGVVLFVCVLFCLLSLASFCVPALFVLVLSLVLIGLRCRFEKAVGWLVGWLVV